MTPIESIEGGVRIAVRVQPRAARTGVAGRHGERLRIRLAAPPVDGAANEALVRFLAEALSVPPRAIAIVSGHASRSKIVTASGVSASEAAARLGLG